MAERAKDKTAEDSLWQVTRQTTPVPISTQMKMKWNPWKQSRQGGKTVWLIALHDKNLLNRSHRHLQKGLERPSDGPSLPQYHESTVPPIDLATANTRKVTGTCQLALWTKLLTPSFCPAQTKRQGRIPGTCPRMCLQASSSPAAAETSARKQKPSETKKWATKHVPSVRVTQSVSRSSTIQSTPSS